MGGGYGGGEYGGVGVWGGGVRSTQLPSDHLEAKSRPGHMTPSTSGHVVRHGNGRPTTPTFFLTTVGTGTGNWSTAIEETVGIVRRGEGEEAGGGGRGRGGGGYKVNLHWLLVGNSPTF